MKFPFVILFLSAILARPVRADEQMRQVQEELRRRHLFYADIDGREGPDVDAALKRYQQRQGFPATGQPDEITLRSLGVLTAAPGPTEPLPDVPVLRSDSAPHDASQELANATPAPPPPISPAKTTAATRADLRKFLRGYFDACQTSDPADELGYYAERVNYFDHGQVDQAYIANELTVYDQRWPKRKYTLGDSLRINKSGDKLLVRCRVTFDVGNEQPARRATGQTDDTFVLGKRADGTWQIESIQEDRVARRGKNSSRRANPIVGALHRVRSAVRGIFR